MKVEKSIVKYPAVINEPANDAVLIRFAEEKELDRMNEL